MRDASWCLRPVTVTETTTLHRSVLQHTRVRLGGVTLGRGGMQGDQRRQHLLVYAVSHNRENETQRSYGVQHHLQHNRLDRSATFTLGGPHNVNDDQQRRRKKTSQGDTAHDFDNRQTGDILMDVEEDNWEALQKAADDRDTWKV